MVTQANHIEEKRLLLEEQNLIEPLLANTTQLLRDELNRLNNEYNKDHEAGMARLSEDNNWKKLTPEQRNTLLAESKTDPIRDPHNKGGKY